MNRMEWVFLIWKERFRILRELQQWNLIFGDINTDLKAAKDWFWSVLGNNTFDYKNGCRCYTSQVALYEKIGQMPLPTPPK